ncbi:expressed unknown protein [Seminavis robusta]|uniref:Uncharacterized protein n=1 Tax=Seminavis robusta TaxID=568900 RepID=A0A9N8HQ79_9STRA|nr:expressed unknown protein [Seminavis robusta]|eukprot:Sro1258_g256880.1 n/a (242) ;mRNA; r:30189-30914
MKHKFCSYRYTYAYRYAYGYIFLLACLAVLPVADTSDATVGEDFLKQAKISKECAAILAVAGGAVEGSLGLAARLLVLKIIAYVGFTAIGGSFSEWWQSTMPLRSKEDSTSSLFSWLQAIAMTVSGPDIAIAIGNILGGVLAVIFFMEYFCAKVDQAVQSNMEFRKLVAAVVVLVIKESFEFWPVAVEESEAIIRNAVGVDEEPRWETEHASRVWVSAMEVLMAASSLQPSTAAVLLQIQF